MDAMTHTQSDPERFVARVRLSIDGRVFPEVVAYLQSIPARKVNKTLESLLVRAIITSPPEAATSPSSVFAPGAQTSPPGHAAQSKSQPASRARRPRAAPSSALETAERLPTPQASALASGDLSAFGTFDESAFAYSAGGDGA